MSEEQKKSTVSKGKIIIALLLAILVVGGYYGLKFYNVYFAPNTTGKEKFLYIRTGFSKDDLFKELEYKEILKDIGTFSQAAAKMELGRSLKPGRYPY